MIEVTCGACGAVQQIADADIPPLGKSVTCASCKSRIAVPAPRTGGDNPRSVAAGALGGAALPDLPSPRRPSPLANAGAATRPIPKSPLEGAEDLPAPKPIHRPDVPRDPAGSGPMRSSSAEDLPAPKRQQPPAIPPPISGGADLVAPKRAPSMPSIPAKPTVPAIPPMMGKNPAATSMGMPSPPPPATPVNPARTSMGLPAPRPPATPAPADIDLDDLLAPAAKGATDLPAPKRGESDLPAPKRPVQPDLPAPKRASDIVDLPEPARNQPGSTDLPAPKGFFDDLPQPAKNQGSTDLPAPKGFFDDLPQPAKAGKPELPAPKGFFDDIPQPARNQSGVPQPARNQSAVPQPVSSKQAPPRPSAPPPVAAKPAKPNPGDRGHAPSAPPPTADDLFNDLTPPPVYATPPALDLDDLDLGPSDTHVGSTAPPAAAEARAKKPTSASNGSGSQPARTQSPSAPPPSGTRSTEDSDVEGQALPMLDLGDGGASADFGSVDLPSLSAPTPMTAGPAGVAFKAKPSGSGNHEAMQLPVSGDATDLSLDVEETKKPPVRRAKRTSMKSAKKAVDRAPTSRRTRIVLLVLLLLAGAGAGGYYLWQRYQKAQAREAELDGMLRDARAALLSGTAGHWRLAHTKAAEVFASNSRNGEAAGIAAQAAYASVFDEGKTPDQLASAGSAIIDKALGVPLSGTDLNKAQGLRLIKNGQAKRALETYLDPVAKAAPNDANAALYQGWGRLAVGDYTGAIESFDRSAKAMPKRDLPALIGRARAKLAQGDLAGARADYAAVLAKDKTHVAAQVGLAASAGTPAEITQREKDLMVLVQTKDFDKADPRAVALAYTLAGDDARRSNRFDAARERYRKAAQKAPLEVAPLRGLAELELREGKLDAAAETIAKGTKIAPDDIDLLVVAGELDLRNGKPADAEAKMTKLRDLAPTSPAHKTKVFLFAGALLEAQGKPAEALEAYLDAIKTADPYDVAPPLAGAALLGKMAAADATKADALRAQAAALLAPLEEKAGSEPSIAIALGIGYLAAGDAGKAERWLRSAIAAKPDDIDAHFQLAEALSRQGKRDEALAILRKAFDFDKTRLDVGIQLARLYEDAGRMDDAAAMYDQLLAGKEVTLDLRGRAGRFYVLIDKLEKARLQGDEILKVDAQHPAGLFLKGMGLANDGKYEEARRSLSAATENDKDPFYFDNYGQVCERLLETTQDTRYRDEALRAYGEAIKGDPKRVNPLAGTGRLYLRGNQASKAKEPLLAALKLAPDDPDIQYGLGLVYYLNDPTTAIAYMGKSLAAKPRSDGFRNIATLYASLEKFKPAEASMLRATEMGQSEENAGGTVEWLTEAYYDLGRFANENRHWPVVRKSWQTYIDRNPKDAVKVDKTKRELLGIPD